MKVIRRFLRTVDATNEWLGRGVSFLILLVIAIVVFEVVARYVFNRPTIWAHEMSLFLYGPYFMLAGGYVLLHKAHVNVDIIHLRLSLRARVITDLVTALLFFFYAGLLLWQGGQMAWESVVIREVNATFWAPITYPFKLLLPISAFLLLMQGLAKFIRDFITAVSGKEATGEIQ